MNNDKALTNNNSDESQDIKDEDFDFSFGNFLGDEPVSKSVIDEEPVSKLDDNNHELNPVDDGETDSILDGDDEIDSILDELDDDNETESKPTDEDIVEENGSAIDSNAKTKYKLVKDPTPDAPIKGVHPKAGIFPPMKDEELADLVKSIRKNGFQGSIQLDKDRYIIDGANRQKACEIANVTPRYRIWDGLGSLQEFVLMKNMHRRHLSATQKAFIAARFATLKQGQKLSDISCKTTDSLTIQEASEKFKANEQYTKKAKRIIEKGIDEVIDAVSSDRISIQEGFDLSDLGQSEQLDALNKLTIDKAAPKPKVAFSIDTARNSFVALFAKCTKKFNDKTVDVIAEILEDSLDKAQMNGLIKKLAKH
jgi:hypothetical protein